MNGRELNEAPKFSLFIELNSTRDYTDKFPRESSCTGHWEKLQCHTSADISICESNQQRTGINVILRTPTSEFKKVYIDLLHGCCFVTVMK